ncbi:LacI family DNA-binding transcriptional regulator [Schleiferilactobacillus perolens]|jgi:LacI family transcriptional regulator|uniref:LacI family DNA-binding transcriptional regulator n=1 Tax=Schleiferilactobacillus perolens TaxID=100468 RepID=UPI002356223F|nr:LacI family DNA-binding transcriptional regulator [Schleiferilactobacillus perolens]MCI2169986.1 LacI family transcriptional regulator [Schleiferilactobacillus perolens]
MAVTIRDVARAAGVSNGTVSRVFNNYSDISPETRKRVITIAQKMGYIPNVAARTLSSKSLQVVALILSDLQSSKANSIPMEMISGVYRYTEEHDMQFVLYHLTTTKQQYEKSFDQFCQERNITGAIIQGLKTSDPYFDEITKSSVPVVLVDLDRGDPSIGMVSINNVQAENEATQILLRNGAQNVVMINGAANAQVSIQREAGFRLALSSFGRTLKDYTVQYANFIQETAVAKVQQLLRNHPDVDGLVCASDLMAIGILEYLRKQKIRVPEDIQLIGFDNLIIGQYMTPTLSSVEQHMELIGQQSCHLLNKMMRGMKKSEPKRIFVPYEIMERDSTAISKEN